MNRAFNPYAAPQSSIAAGPAAGAGVCRDGKLVRMDVEGALPDRCVRCNRSADGYRVERTFYWRPDWWRAFVWTVPPALFVVGLAVGSLFIAAFWLSLLGVMAGDIFARRRIVIEYGLCARHRRQRNGVIGGFVVSWLLVVILAVLSAGGGLRAVNEGWFWLLALTMFALAIVAGLMRGVRLAGRSEQHLWLRGAAPAFYEALPAAGERSA